jgi:glycosyltransferase involved in cell wall biosynthesis
MPVAPKRIDLHCHSDASNKTGEAVLNALHCPESYSRPEEVYAQAQLRGMDFITLTDHDSIDGALQIVEKPNVLIGEELTCWFPEDNCKMHVLIYGISREQHDSLQSLAKNIYDVADYIEAQTIAHAVAHPIYRQNDKLERWHLERLFLLFKGFECLNGAHSALHREAFEPLLDRLTKIEIARLSETHGLQPHWPQPWTKARIGGSDDHGLLNVGRTWTEFPPDAETTDDILNYLRIGICQPGGEAGSSAKLAHTFYSVAVRYYTRHLLSPNQPPNIATALLQTIAGEKPAPSRRRIAIMGFKHKLKKLTQRVVKPAGQSPLQPTGGTGHLKKLFLNSVLHQIKNQPELRAALESGLPPLGDHERMFSFVNDINRDVTEGLAAAIEASIDEASFTNLFDTIGAICAQQFVLLPYYFAVFHQNKERHLLREITRSQPKEPRNVRIGLFTDTFDEINGVARFIGDMSRQAEHAGNQLIVHTCTRRPGIQIPGLPLRKNFEPLLSRDLPFYSDLKLNLPPLLEILEWADRQQFDAIHVSTPGPMGLCGWLVSKMLRVPMLATYHTDFPAYVDSLARDHRITNGTTAYMKWFYGQAAAVFARSNAYLFNLRDLNVTEEKLRLIPAGVDVEKFQSAIREPRRTSRLLYCGRVSVEKNLPFLVDVFSALSRKRPEIKLVVAGDGPYLAEMKNQLRGLPVEFRGFQNDRQLAALYANSDLLIFPSRSDTLGQVVMEAQACGLPAIVSNEGGPKETVEHNLSGLVLSTHDIATWCSAIEELLDDEPRRLRMSRAATTRMSKCSLNHTFESFWANHLSVIESSPGVEEELASFQKSI